MPTYLYENFSMDLAAAGFHSMFYTHIAAFAGVLIAGRLSDRWAGKDPANRMVMQGLGLLAAFHSPLGGFSRLRRIRLRKGILRRQHLHCPI